MNFMTKIFAFFVLSAAFGWASAGDAEGEKSAKADKATTQVAEESAETAQSADTEQSAKTAVAVEEEVPWEDQVRCKRIQKTGSRTSSKICATNREWKQSSERGQRATKELQRRQHQWEEQ